MSPLTYRSQFVGISLVFTTWMSAYPFVAIADEPFGIARTRADDIRLMAPPRPSRFTEERGAEPRSIAAPESGGDLNSVRDDWVIRQIHLATNGGDQKFLEDVNVRLNRAITRGDSTTDNVNGTSHSGESLADDFVLVPRSIRFTAINRFELGLASSARLSCAVNGDSIRWDLSRALTERIDFNLSHETSGNANLLRLHYNW